MHVCGNTYQVFGVWLTEQFIILRFYTIEDVDKFGNNGLFKKIIGSILENKE